MSRDTAREIVIENDIAWRIDTMVDYLFGRMPVIRTGFVLGTIALGGKTLRVLAIEPAPGLVVEAALDPATGRILRSRGASRDPGMPLEFVTTYSDFRKVDGVLVPMHEENFANGRTTGETVLSKVEFPGKLPDGTFRP